MSKRIADCSPPELLIRMVADLFEFGQGGQNHTLTMDAVGIFQGVVDPVDQLQIDDRLLFVSPPPCPADR